MKTSTLKKYTIIWRSTGLLLFPLGFIFLYMILSSYKEYYGKAKTHNTNSILPPIKNDTLKIAIIGDSWVYFHQHMGCDTILSNFIKTKYPKPVYCISKGHSGETTRGIYLDSFRKKKYTHEWEKEFCTEHILEMRPNYCIIMAGINDVWHQIPPQNYAYNYKLIIKRLLETGIRPVVLEIPNFDVKKTINDLESFKYSFFRYISLCINGGYHDISDYRKALLEIIDEYNWNNNVLYISSSKWNPGGVSSESELYQNDRLHLCYKGYLKLDSCLATEICNNYEL